MARQYEFHWRKKKKAALSMAKSLIHAAQCLWWDNWTRQSCLLHPSTRSWQLRALWPQLIVVPRWPSFLFKRGQKCHSHTERENEDPWFRGSFWLICPKNPMRFIDKLRIIMYQLLGRRAKARNLFLSSLARRSDTWQTEGFRGIPKSPQQIMVP